MTVQRRSEHSSDGAGGESWILRLEGRLVTDELMNSGIAPPTARRLVLSEEEFQTLVALLRDSDPGNLPQSLFAAQYTDLSVQILTLHRNVAARRFLGMTPETHGAEQQAFDRIYEAFHALHERLRKEGKPFQEVQGSGFRSSGP